MASELVQLRVELAARPARLRLTRTHHDAGHSVDRAIVWIAECSGQGVVQIALNVDSNPVEVAIEGARISESVAPFDVHVYRPQSARKSHSRK